MAMSAIATQTAYDAFLETLQHACEPILIMNYDGAVMPFSHTRETRLSVSGLLDCILAGARTRVVLISARELRDLTALRASVPHPELWGCNGLERLHSDGRYELTELGEQELKALAEADAWLEREGIQSAVELKAGGIAVHWSGYSGSELKEVRTKAFRALVPFVRASKLVLVEMDGCLELRIGSNKKGDIVRTILSELREEVPIAYVGADVTDEDAFCALKGHGLGVLVTRDDYLSSADVWLQKPEQLLEFLNDWLRVCRSQK